MLGILASLLFALSLCADCFAVSACSSVTLGDVARRRILGIALVFAFIQSGLLVAGWAFGDSVVGLLGGVAHVVGFLLLAWVGGSMVWSAWKDKVEVRDLNGLRNILVGAVATSIDAFAAGMSLSMDGESAGDLAVKVAAVFLVTLLTVVAGIKGGQLAGKRYGRAARWVGGFVLLGIGLNILL